jgi:hypothetical protein
MPIFTFMSASDLQRDDAYSFGVVEKVYNFEVEFEGNTDLTDCLQDRTCHDSIPSRQGPDQAGAVQRSVAST